MHVISQKRLREFWQQHPDAETPLRVWHTMMEQGSFETPHELQQSFPKVDFVGSGRAVFNVGGNKYRLIADVRYQWRRVYVVAVLTHEEYDWLDVTTL